MRTSLKTRTILGYLNDSDMLVLNKNSYECRRPVKNSDKSQKSFVILKKKYYTNGSKICPDIKNIIYDNPWGNDPYENI